MTTICLFFFLQPYFLQQLNKKWHKFTTVNSCATFFAVYWASIHGKVRYGFIRVICETDLGGKVKRQPQRLPWEH
jgi:hypothetical protein